MRRLSTLAMRAAMIAILGSLLSTGTVAAAGPVSGPPSTPAGVIPPGVGGYEPNLLDLHPWADLSLLP